MKKTLFSLLFIYLFTSCDPARFDRAPAHHNEEVKAKLSSVSSLSGTYYMAGEKMDKKVPLDSFVQYNFNHHIGPNPADTNEMAKYILLSLMSDNYLEIKAENDVMHFQVFSLINKAIFDKAFEGKTTIYASNTPNDWMSMTAKYEGDSLFLTLDESDHKVFGGRSFHVKYVERGGFLFVSPVNMNEVSQNDFPDSIDLNEKLNHRFLTLIGKDLYYVRFMDHDDTKGYNIFQLHFVKDSILIDQVSCDNGSKSTMDSLGLKYDGKVHYEESKMESLFNSKLAGRAKTLVKMYGFPSFFNAPEKVTTSLTISQYLLLAFVFFVAALSLFTSRSNRNH